MKNKRVTDKYKRFNHHHEMTENHQLVDFGDGEFIANKKAIPLLKALNDLGLCTRTHHVDDSGGFVSVLINGSGMRAEIREVNERDSTRTEYDGMTELLISWRS